MKRKKIKQVGILVLHDKIGQRYSINPVHVAKTLGGGTEAITQIGLRLKLHRDFQGIVNSVADAYASAIRNIWVQNDWCADKAYLQFGRLAAPGKVGLDGEWLWWAQR